MNTPTMLKGLTGRALRLPAPPLGDDPVLETQGVTVTYGGAAVLGGVDLAVRAGQVLALVGPNGAGKSTLLAVLAGDIKPDEGTTTVGGHPHGHWSSDELAVRRGVLLQQVDVSFPFTVTQIVRMGRAPWAGTPAEDWDDDVVSTSLIETETAALSGRIYTSLSGGERARAALARVLAQEPLALLLDEPTASLDIRHQELVSELTRRRAARGDAVVVVLHDLGLAAACADVILVLAAGRAKAFGPPAEVLTPELLSEVYEHPIEVVHHPADGSMLIVPHRRRSPSVRHLNPMPFPTSLPTSRPPRSRP